MCRVLVLGSGDAFHSGGRSHASFLIKAKYSKLLVDCGGGSLQQLKKYGYSTSELTAIIVSHLHGDHIGGLPFILMDMARLKREKIIYILSPPGLKGICHTVLKSYYPGHEKILDSLPVSWITYQEGKVIDFDNVAVEPFKMVHAEEARPFGVRMTIDDRIIAYSGDTEWHDNILNLAKDADLFICECTFFKTKVDGHLNYAVLSEKAASIECTKILLTHFDEEMIRNADKVGLEMASDGQEISLKSNVV